MLTKGTVYTMGEIASLKLRSRKILKGKNNIFQSPNFPLCLFVSHMRMDI